MNREKEREKFAEFLDRLLAGGEIPDDPQMDEELRETLDFARILAGLRRNPSPGYQSSLRARLLQQLEERARKSEEKKVSFWRQPVWQGVVAAVFVIIILSVLWRAGVFSPPTPPYPTTTATPTAKPPIATAQGIRLSFSVRTDKAAYQPGENVEIILTIGNAEPRQITLEKLPPIVSLMSAETSKPVYTFTSGTDTRTLAPNQTITLTLVWNQEDFGGNPVTGRYYIELEDLVYQGMPVQLHLAQPVEFYIQSYH